MGLVRTDRALLSLLRAGMWEKEEPTDCFPLTAGEWEEVFRKSMEQTVTGVTFRGLDFITDTPPDPLLLKWAAEADAIERRNRKMNRELAALLVTLQSGGIDPVLQKGQSVARFYPEPLLRECGDIDLYFRTTEEADAAAALIRQRGISTTRHADGSLFYIWNGIPVEHHTRLFDLHNPFSQKQLRRQPLQWDTYTHSTDIKVTIPDPASTLLMMNTHILKHALGWGIGLRQLCDITLACSALHGAVRSKEMQDTCRRMRIRQWTPLLHSFMEDCLGLPHSCLPYPEVSGNAQPLLDIVFRGGNFGRKSRKGSGGAEWKRKLLTAGSFRHNLGFALRYAPAEGFWTVMSLIKGQLA